MAAGDGASVVYVDAITAAGFAHELTNYGKYSGGPSEGQTFDPPPRPDGRILVIGGSITNFTNVAATFKGIIGALEGAKAGLITHGMSPSGPNWQEGLKAMRLCGESLGVPIRVFGPDTHIAKIVPLALSTKPVKAAPASIPATMPASPKAVPATPSAAAAPTPSNVGTVHASGECTQPDDVVMRFDDAPTQNGHAATKCS
ncbi:hypothetical protein J3R83DRAFT_5463 [Lanmaoa asiatica]|nr:hypothetical protein J3R83DRAFT_5463 [Lanmaoa asiatica]